MGRWKEDGRRRDGEREGEGGAGSQAFALSLSVRRHDKETLELVYMRQ